MSIVCPWCVHGVSMVCSWCVHGVSMVCVQCFIIPSCDSSEIVVAKAGFCLQTDHGGGMLARTCRLRLTGFSSTHLQAWHCAIQQTAMNTLYHSATQIVCIYSSDISLMTVCYNLTSA